VVDLSPEDLDVCVALWMGEVLGRKKTVLVSTTVMTIGTVIQIASYSVPQMIAGRIVAGIGNGINLSTAPIWQTETSALKWCGKLVVIELILNIAGFSLSNCMTYAFSFTTGPVSWRFPLAFQLIFMSAKMAGARHECLPHSRLELLSVL
jgi:MFS family permease